MHARLLATFGLVTMIALAGCSGSGSSATPSTTTPSTTTPSTTTPSTAASPTAASPTGATFPSAALAPGTQYYVSLGDSYAAGYQGTGRGRGQGRTTTNGFAYQVVTKAKAKGYDFRLVNFGCAGATTQTMLTTSGCRRALTGPGAPQYSATQTAAAVAFIKAHRGHIALVTVSIGGNDVIPCGVRSDALSCLTTNIAKVRSNLNTILQQVRAAAGTGTRIVGTTYPDVLLGNLLSKDANLRSLASLSVTAFKALINPQLQQAYQAVGGRFVDVTAAFGSYGSLSQTTSLPPYGTIPVPTAKICSLTFYCVYQDIHPRTPGYGIIADLVTATLPPA